MVADVFTWVMSEMTTRFFEHVGDSQPSTTKTTEAHKLMNDYYQNVFPLELDLDLLNSIFTQALSGTDSGHYALDQTVLRLDEPHTINGGRIVPYYDNSFFDDYPDDEQFITDPGLAIGSDTAKISNSAFSYDLQGDSYSASAGDTAFSGLSTVPQNKYGAFSLKINSDGTVTIVEASGNATGYDTVGQAINGLPVADADTAYMGFVTVINTGGGFIPGTTALDAGTVTDTYTDGKHQNRGEPQASYIFDEVLYIRPKPDRIMEFAAPCVVRPAAIDTGAPLDIAWGPTIALGAAILKLIEDDADSQRGAELARVFQSRKRSIDRKQRKQRQPQYAEPSF